MLLRSVAAYARGAVSVFQRLLVSEGEDVMRALLITAAILGFSAIATADENPTTEENSDVALATQMATPQTSQAPESVICSNEVVRTALRHDPDGRSSELCDAFAPRSGF